ncbi:PilZ domain-containing protein [Reinekea forsetii]|uniref:PilZ domain-containing protein n=1 Tax=Reinekea forsetii TaxID=1336806 RepID=UPI00235616FD|nr:PilZ domain-containing protein [Reinekea forsetii]
MDDDQRQHPRTPIKMVVQLTLDQGQGLQVETRDISNGGIGIHRPTTPVTDWCVGMKVQARIVGLPIEGPELTLSVVNISAARIGLKIL